MNWLRQNNGQKLKITSHKEIISDKSGKDSSIQRGSLKSKLRSTIKSGSSYNERESKRSYGHYNFNMKNSSSSHDDMPRQ